MPTRQDLVYDEPGGIPLRFDLYLPESGGTHPLIVCIHGGGWISGEKEDMADVARALAQRGFAAACPDYSLAPLHPFPAAVRDCRRFVAHCRENAAELGIDPGRIAALGNSAGGHLSAMLAATDGSFLDAPTSASTRVNVAVSICPLTDLEHAPDKHFPISMAFIEQFLGGPYEGLESRYREASPLHHVDASCAPMLLIHGDADDVVSVEQSDALDQALAAASVRHAYYRMPGEGHSFTFPAWTQIERLYLEFLRTELSSGVGALS